MNLLKKIFNYNKLNYVILGMLILVFLVSTIVYSLLTTHISDIEKNKIIEDTTPYINYIEEIENSDSKDIDRYILYALEYYKYVKAEDNIKTETINDFIYRVFNIELGVDQIKAFGINPTMMKKGVIYNIESDTYSIVFNKRNLKELEETPVVYYKREKIQIYNTKKYKVKYKKYIIDNPLELLNKALEYNTTVDNIDDEVQIIGLREYL